MKFKSFDRNTLFIIGNGFDVAHNIKSRFANFREYLIRYNYNNVVNDLEKMFPEIEKGKILLWEDFERALGLYNPSKIYDDYMQGFVDPFFDKPAQARVSNRIKPIIKCIPVLLKEWVTHIDGLNDCQQKMKLCTKSFYLNFNYTLVLEKCYFIPHKQVCHVHGRVPDIGENDDKHINNLIIGHDNRRNPFHESDKSTNKEISKQLIVEVMNENVKPVDDIILNHEDFFISLNDISQVIVLGHSLSKIDMPYFVKIQEAIAPRCVWYLSWYDEKDKAKIEKLTKSSIFRNSECRGFEFKDFNNMVSTLSIV